ncbi:uncharacterized protein LOC114802144 [Denticeps clupeoides]|uniref:uncharacterized protein LOC114802144 n=1 Tax=Denticeps clupeoides TaxID=299321 RepID=UPI0010A37B3D|nr:uncharacterized protein LOC114802144 [Denticeps clupeoides]
MDPAGDVELTQIHGEKRSANNNNTDTVDQASPGNGACVVDGGTEDASLLGRGEQDADGDGVESDETSRLDPPVGPEVTAARAVFCGFWPLACRRKLNKKVVGKLRLWMVLILLIIFIALVIIISILTCSAARQEPEDQYDVSSFVLRRLFRGNVSSNSTDAALEDEFHAQLNHVFQSSAALGRYFNQSRTASRKGDVHLYDRGFEEADRLKLDPASLSMEGETKFKYISHRLMQRFQTAKTPKTPKFLSALTGRKRLQILISRMDTGELQLRPAVPPRRFHQPTGTHNMLMVPEPESPITIVETLLVDMKQLSRFRSSSVTVDL